jgi:Pvc16 N-terminal domain
MSEAAASPADDAEPQAAAQDSGQVLRCVSESLRGLIRAHIAELRAESAVVFESPAELGGQSETKLSLYLYQLEINPYLRNLPPTLTRDAGTRGPNSLQVLEPPLVADLLYMMVPYARSAELELVLVDKLVRLFHNVPALSGPWLHPSLRAAGNSAIPIVPDFASFERLHNMWAGFPGKSYKLTKLYTLSPVRIPSDRQVSVDMVTQGELQAQLLPRELSAGVAL